MTLIIGGLVFVLVATIWIGVVVVWRIRRRAHEEQLRARLGVHSAPQEGGRVLRLWRDGQEVTTTFDRMTRGFSWRERMTRACRQAGLESPLSVILSILGSIMLAAFLLTLLLLHSLVPAVVAVIAVPLIFNVYLNYRTNRRGELFERQFLDALQIATRSLRAGHPLIGAFRFIADEVDAPVGELFGNICQQQSLGMSLEEALRQVSEESSSDDMQLFTSSVLVHLHSGGPLADMMERLAEVIRDRVRLSHRVRVLIAQTQLSKRVLLSMPFIFFAVINVVNPAYMQPLYTEFWGHVLLAGGGVCLLLGAWVMNRMAVVHY
jgi:tight adherence protein B